MASILVTVLQALQAGFAGYNLYLSTLSIQNLLKYEDSAKKAAKYSNIADDQLQKTRYTQASMVISILFSLLSSTYLIWRSRGTATTFIVSGVNISGLAAAWQYVGDFWKGKAKIPLPRTGEYNEAIGKTQEVHLNMSYLMGSWVVVGFLGLML